MDLEQLRASKAVSITRVQAAEVLGVDPRTVSQGVAQGTIPAIRVGRRVVILREPFLALLTNPSGNTAPEAPLQQLRIG